MDVPCRIRAATASDLPALAALEGAIFPDPWSVRAFAPHLADPTFVAEGDDGALLGYIVSRLTAHDAEILNVAVGPDARRRGIGRALLGTTLGVLARGGVRRVYLEVRASNEAARRLYVSEGFVVVGLRPAYYRNPPEDAVLLARNIGSASER